MLKHHPVMLYVTWFVALIAAPAPLIVLLDNGLIDSPRNMLLYHAGIVAYVWWLVIIWLSARPQWLDRFIGLPAMYAVHGMLGIFALAAASIHVLFSFSMHEIIRNLGLAAWYLAIFGVVYAGFFMSGLLVDRLPLAARIKRRLQFFFKHELSVWVHRLNLVVIVLIWLHVHVIPRISRLTDFIIVFDLYTACAFGAYAWSKFVAPASQRRSGQVLSNDLLTEHVHKITIRLGSKAPQYRAGDFYFLSFTNVPGIDKVAHPFSASNQPDDRRTVTFTIKALGDFTKSLSKVPSGADVKLEGPFGRFDPLIAKDGAGTPLILIGMGTGLSPLVSLAEQYAALRSVHLLWSVRDDEKELFSEQLNTLHEQHPDQVKVERSLHRFKPQDYRAAFDEREVQSGRFVIVGPAAGVLSTKKMLRDLGISTSRILDERLTM